MPRLLAVLLLTFTACAEPPISEPIPGPAGPQGEAGPAGAPGPTGLQGGSTVKSGTRLKARVARSEDGASQFLGWWDSEMGMECERERGAMSDGAWSNYRCLPVRSVHTGNYQMWSDAECTLKAVPVSTQTLFCSVWDGARYVFHRPGRSVERLFEVKNGDCVESETTQNDWRACGDEPPFELEAFAAMPEQLED